MARATGLQMRTLRIVRNRLTQIADARGVIDTTVIKELFDKWERRDTDVDAIAAAGRIRKMALLDKWSAEDQQRFLRQNPIWFTRKVTAYMGRMNKAGSNNFLKGQS